MKIDEYAECTDYFTGACCMRVWGGNEVTFSMWSYDDESIDGAILCAKEVGLYDDGFVDELYRMVFDEAVIAKHGYSMHATVWCDTEVL